MRIEKKHAKGAMQQTFVDIVHQVACILESETWVKTNSHVKYDTSSRLALTRLFRLCTDTLVVFIDHDAHLTHETHLLFVVLVQVGGQHDRSFLGSRKSFLRKKMT